MRLAAVDTEVLNPTAVTPSNGVCTSVPAQEIVCPVGALRSLSGAVWGSRRTLSVPRSPCESVAVRVSSRCESASWSVGASKLASAPERLSG